LQQRLLRWHWMRPIVFVLRLSNTWIRIYPIVAAVAVTGLLIQVSAYASVGGDGPLEVEVGTWLALINNAIVLAFRLDSVSLLFLWLGAGLVLCHLWILPSAHLPRDQVGRAYAFVLLALCAFGGLVLSENLLFLYVFWEALGLTSYFLAVLPREERSQVSGVALRMLMVSHFSGYGLLAAILIVSRRSDQYLYGDVPTGVFDALVVGLVLAAVAARASWPPFHGWAASLRSHLAPIYASLAGIMLLGAMYVVARFLVLAGPEPFLPWSNVLLIVGALALALSIAAMLAMGRLASLLAVNWIGHGGLIAVAVALGTYQAMAGAALILFSGSIGMAFVAAAGPSLLGINRQSQRAVWALPAAIVVIGIAALAGVMLPLSAASRSFLFTAVALEPWALPIQFLIILFGVTTVVTFGRWMQRLFVNPPLTAVRRLDALHDQGNLVWLLIAGAAVMAVLQWRFAVLVWPAVTTISHAAMTVEVGFSWTTLLIFSTLSTTLVGGVGVIVVLLLRRIHPRDRRQLASLARVIGGAADRLLVPPNGIFVFIGSCLTFLGRISVVAERRYYVALAMLALLALFILLLETQGITL
jgi:formate hydrogenlyase subunit 3/multisubunit Na+/H+ antiporter MnhD subunit